MIPLVMVELSNLLGGVLKSFKHLIFQDNY